MACLQTNIPFLLNVLEHPKFVAGNVNTYFIDENPHLFDFVPSMNRAQKLLNYVGGVLVNGPMTPFGTNVPPVKVTPVVPELPKSESLLCLVELH
jgi:pyruvate carboxylase